MLEKERRAILSNNLEIIEKSEQELIVLRKELRYLEKLVLKTRAGVLINLYITNQRSDEMKQEDAKIASEQLFAEEINLKTKMIHDLEDQISELRNDCDYQRNKIGALELDD